LLGVIVVVVITIFPRISTFLALVIVLLLLIFHISSFLNWISRYYSIILIKFNLYFINFYKIIKNNIEFTFIVWEFIFFTKTGFWGFGVLGFWVTKNKK
jgi:hypothetical protein